MLTMTSGHSMPNRFWARSWIPSFSLHVECDVYRIWSRMASALQGNYCYSVSNAAANFQIIPFNRSEAKRFRGVFFAGNALKRSHNILLLPPERQLLKISIEFHCTQRVHQELYLNVVAGVV